MKHMDKKLKSRLLRLTEDQMEYLKLKAKDTFDLSVQKYSIAKLFPRNWRIELEELRKKQKDGAF